MGFPPPSSYFKHQDTKRRAKKPTLMAKSLKKYFPKILTELHKDVETSQIAK